MSGKVLVLVDDNQAHRLIFKRFIAKSGLISSIDECSGCKSARETLSKVYNEAATRPAIFLIDLNLGDGRGSDLVREIRAMEAFAAIPIIAISTSSRLDDIQDCYAAGANCFVSKGDSPSGAVDDIVAAISFLLTVHNL